MKHILLSGLLLSALTLSAQQSNTLQDYRKMALDYNHDLRAAQRNLSISMDYEKSIRADRKPKMALGANAQYTGNPTTLDFALPSMENPIHIEGSNWNYGTWVGVEQPIFTGGRLLQTLKMAQTEQALTQQQVYLVHNLVCYQTDVQYWNTVGRNELLSIATDFEQSMNNLVTLIKERVDVGLINPQDLLMVEVKQNEAQYQVLQATTGYETGCMALNALISEQLHGFIPADTLVPMLALSDPLLDENVTQHAALIIAKERINMAEHSLKLKQAPFKPRLSVGAEGSYRSPGHDFKKDMDPNYAVYAKLSMSLFEWGKRTKEKKMSRERVDIAADEFQKTKDKITLDVETSKLALKQAIQRSILAQSSLHKAHLNEQQALERYSEGKSSIVEVIDAQMYRQNAQILFAQAKIAAQIHRSELINALNGYL
ncbi:MAG: TolC family protein [Marinifilaceae bacterium]